MREGPNRRLAHWKQYLIVIVFDSFFFISFYQKIIYASENNRENSAVLEMQTTNEMYDRIGGSVGY